MLLNQKARGIRAFTLVEVAMAIAIMGVLFSGVIVSYVHTARRTEWSGYSLAAQALAIQQLEQARSAKWDVLDTPVVDEVTNLPLVTATTLDIPISGTNRVIATNYVTLRTIMISSNPVVSVHLVRVDTVWPFTKGHSTVYFTNSVANYISPDR